MSLSTSQAAQLRVSLQQATIGCSERCLYHSFRWAAELLDALPGHGPEDASAPEMTPFASPLDARQKYLEDREFARFLQAKALFDCHEYLRCAAVLLPGASAGHTIPPKAPEHPSRLLEGDISQRSLFLALYALMMAGEKRKAEELGQPLGPFDVGTVENRQLSPIRSILGGWLDRNAGTSQGWLEYLYGLVMVKDRNSERAVAWLLKSVSLNPWNWGAWQELAALVRDVSHLKWAQSQLAPNIMGFIFSVYCRQQLHQDFASLVADINQLQSIFPGSLFLQGQRALVYYRAKDIYEANSLFSSMMASDPRCLDFVDHYSNVLYTLDDRAKLAFLAQISSAVDRYRPETCCVIGNYYSRIDWHEEAVLSFRRALLLDRGFSAAWTLLGHEYVQLQNTHAAISSYRRAIEFDQNDYRACVGLGQAYEALNQPTFALFYYRRSVKLRPRDADLWQSLANCLTALSMFPQAIKALQSALTHMGFASNDESGTRLTPPLRTLSKRVELLLQLSRLQEEREDRHAATDLLEVCVDEYFAAKAQADAGEEEDLATAESAASQAQLQLARWALDNNDRVRAAALAAQIAAGSQFWREARDVREACSGAEDLTIEGLNNTMGHTP